MNSDKKYFVYWIVADRRSYIGATVNPQKRLRQHNRQISGGARRTRGKLWHFHCVLSGFRTWREALQCEWSFKHISRNCRGIESRRSALETLLQKERWTSNSPLASEVPLTVEYLPTKYGEPPEQLAPNIETKVTKIYKKRQNNYKKKLHGVTY